MNLITIQSSCVFGEGLIQSIHLISSYFSRHFPDLGKNRENARIASANLPGVYAFFQRVQVRVGMLGLDSVVFQIQGRVWFCRQHDPLPNG